MRRSAICYGPVVQQIELVEFGPMLLRFVVDLQLRKSCIVLHNTVTRQDLSYSSCCTTCPQQIELVEFVL